MVILVNATAARSSGALSILNQFIDHIPCGAHADDYVLFVDPDFTQIEKKNVTYVKVDTKKWIRRIIWDGHGLKQWCLKNKIFPQLIISFQNMGVNFSKNVPQLVYYHQLLSLSQYKWNVLKKQGLIFFLYKYFYLFFVSLYTHTNTYFIVQIPSTKRLLKRKVNIADHHIYVVPPEIDLRGNDVENSVHKVDDFFHFIYPATPYVYKNFMILLDTLMYIRCRFPELLKMIKIHLTIKESDDRPFYQKILEKQFTDNFIFEGVIPHSVLLSKYKAMKALVFPSCIESFGLPLLEAAASGIPIIVSDLPYAHDVVGEYGGTRFVKYDNAEQWGEEIIKVCNEKMGEYPFDGAHQYVNTWNTFFEIVESLKK